MVNRTKEKLNVELPPELVAELKERCKFRGEFTYFIEQAVREFLNKHKRIKKHEKEA